MLSKITRKAGPSASPAELGGVIALGLAAAGLLLFAVLAYGVHEGHVYGFDETILLALRSSADPSRPIGPAWMEMAVIDFTALGSTTLLVLVTLLTAGYLAVDGKRSTALFVMAATLGGAGLNYVLKLGFDRPRPDVVPHLVSIHTLSFPSGHAMGTAITYLTLGVLIMRTVRNPAVKAYALTVALVLTLLIGLSRLYLGVHWPTDVLAGWAVGSAWALLCWLVAVWLQKRGEIEPPGSRESSQARFSRPD